MAVKYTEEQLNSVDKSFLIQLLLQQQEQLEAITKELHASNEKIQLLMEQVILGKQNRFGRSSEKMEDTSQICFREIDGTIIFFNEAEAICDLNAAEPEDLELKSPKQPKRKGKKEADLSGLPVRRIDHYLSEEELEAEFGVRGWKQLPDAISRKYHFVPAKVEVEEHHIGVYASKTDEHMVKADHPKALLHGSLVSPSLGAAIINGKYVNAVLSIDWSRNSSVMICKSQGRTWQTGAYVWQRNIYQSFMIIFIKNCISTTSSRQTRRWCL